MKTAIEYTLLTFFSIFLASCGNHVITIYSESPPDSIRIAILLCKQYRGFPQEIVKIQKINGQEISYSNPFFGGLQDVDEFHFLPGFYVIDFVQIWDFVLSRQHGLIMNSIGYRTNKTPLRIEIELRAGHRYELIWPTIWDLGLSSEM
jgi:hypothetical protein